MVESSLSGLVSQWFTEYGRLAYWVARRWVRRLLDCYARDCSPDELEELAQDAIARGFDRFAKRCAKSVCGQSDRKKWVCQCVIRGVRDAIRAKSRFGSVSDGVAVRDDAMNRYKRVAPGFVHGDDNEKQDAMEAVHYCPVVYAVQRWELEELVERELPPHLRPTALYAALGLTWKQSGILQDVSDRTVGNRLQELRDYLCPDANIYAIVCAALEACLNKPSKRDGQPLLPFLADAIG
jgi:DNA-directed RNA polymerase specialized sigma24 family protein